MKAVGLWSALALILLSPSAAWAYRPFVSTDAAVADTHELEIELGYFSLQRSREGDVFTVPQLVLNYGFYKDWELVGEFSLEKPPGTDVQLTEFDLSLKSVLKEGVLQNQPGVSLAVEAEAL